MLLSCLFLLSVSCLFHRLGRKVKLRGGLVGVAAKLLAAKGTSLLQPERKGGGSQEARAARWCRQKDLAS